MLIIAGRAASLARQPRNEGQQLGDGIFRHLAMRIVSRFTDYQTAITKLSFGRPCYRIPRLPQPDTCPLSIQIVPELRERAEDVGITLPLGVVVSIPSGDGTGSRHCGLRGCGQS